MPRPRPPQAPWGAPTCTAVPPRSLGRTLPLLLALPVLLLATGPTSHLRPASADPTDAACQDHPRARGREVPRPMRWGKRLWARRGVWQRHAK